MPLIFFTYKSPQSQYPTDPYFSGVVLGIHGSSPITDITGKSLTISAGVSTSTSVALFGKSSMYFNGTSYIQLSHSEDFNFGYGNFTIELWSRPELATSSRNIFQFGNYSGGWSFTIGYTLNNVIRFGITPASTTGLNAILGSYTDNVWQHIAVVKNNGTFYFYLDGILQGTKADPNPNPWTTTGVSGKTTAGVRVGCGDSALDTWSPAYYSKGYLQDVRVTRGVARYTSNFTPPTTEFPNQ